MNTGDAVTSTQALGVLRADNGAGVFRIEARYPTDRADLWSALTDPERLGRWYGQVTGDLREGGQFQVYLEGPDIRAEGRIEQCQPPSLLRVRTRETDDSARNGNGAPFDQTIEATLTEDDTDTELVIEVRGLPLDKVAAYGVGWQLHTESLRSHVTGHEAPDVPTRWGELSGPYQQLAAQLG
jgi:uncharacterized protein YndB with AHSA1/START domain